MESNCSLPEGIFLQSESASNYEEGILRLYRAQIEEGIVRRGFAEPGDLEVTLIRTADREAQVSITSKSGKNVQEIFRAAFPPEPTVTVPPIFYDRKNQYPEQKLNRAQRRAMRKR